MEIRTDRHQTFDGSGGLVSETVEEVDITAEVEDKTLRDQARTAFENNKTYLASTPTPSETVAQVDAITRQINGLIKLVVDAGLVD